LQLEGFFLARGIFFGKGFFYTFFSLCVAPHFTNIPPDSKLNAPVGISGDYTLAELSQKKKTAMNMMLEEVNKIAIPWSCMAVTPDSCEQPIYVTNTCAHDTVLMALSLLRQYDTDMAFFIKAEGGLLTTVLDNVEQNLHVQSRVTWIRHCDTYVPTSNKYNHFARNFVSKITNKAGMVIQWDCQCTAFDVIRPLSLLKYHVQEENGKCTDCAAKSSQTRKNCIQVEIAHLHDIQAQCLDRYFNNEET
jgi:hypothetical protein